MLRLRLPIPSTDKSTDNPADRPAVGASSILSRGTNRVRAYQAWPHSKRTTHRIGPFWTSTPHTLSCLISLCIIMPTQLTRRYPRSSYVPDCIRPPACLPRFCAEPSLVFSSCSAALWAQAVTLARRLALLRPRTRRAHGALVGERQTSRRPSCGLWPIRPRSNGRTAVRSCSRFVAAFPRSSSYSIFVLMRCFSLHTPLQLILGCGVGLPAEGWAVR